MAVVEEHPLNPFLPRNGRMLFLGSFPPPKARWSMDWFYPNFQNDFWRIQGLIHYGDKTWFETEDKRFDKDRIVQFCTEQGMAFFDTARRVCRLRDNASDNFLQILEPTDVFALLHQMPDCHRIITTGGKASEELVSYLASKGVIVSVPGVGECVQIVYEGSEHWKWTGLWWRMPSSSRAYPMKLERKAEFYQKLP